MKIIGSYLHDNVTVWEGAQVESAILCEGVTIMPNAQVKEGAIISFKVCNVPAAFKIYDDLASQGISYIHACKINIWAKINLLSVLETDRHLQLGRVVLSGKLSTKPSGRLVRGHCLEHR